MSSLLVTGSRDWPSETLVGCVLDEFLVSLRHEGMMTLINGGAAGVDTFAENYWRSHNLGNVITVHPDWNLHGKKAGIIRNVDMLNMDPTYVVAFIYNHSKGATFTINEARKRGMKAYAFTLESPRLSA